MRRWSWLALGTVMLGGLGLLGFGLTREPFLLPSLLPVETHEQETAR